MKAKLVGAYVGAIVCGLVVLAAALLVVLQRGSSSEFSVFSGQPTTVNTALLILGCVAFGVLLPLLLKLLLHCAMTIGQRRRESVALGKATAKAVARQSAPTSQE